MDTRGKCRPLFKFIFSQRPFLAVLDIPKLLSKAAVPVFILVEGVCIRPHVTASRGRRKAAPRGEGGGQDRAGRVRCSPAAEPVHFREDLTPQHQKCRLAFTCKEAGTAPPGAGSPSRASPRPKPPPTSLSPPPLGGRVVRVTREKKPPGQFNRKGGDSPDLRKPPPPPYASSRAQVTDRRKMESGRPRQWCFEYQPLDSAHPSISETEHPPFTVEEIEAQRDWVTRTG